MMLVSLTLLLLCSFSSLALADDSVTPAEAVTVIPVVPTVSATPALGWGPSVVGNVGAFYLNGNYKLLAAGVNAGAAYTWDKVNVNSIGIYVGPQSEQVGTTTTTTLNTMVYLNLYQTATIGGFGIGVGTRFWQSGIGMNKAVGIGTTYLALGYKF